MSNLITSEKNLKFIVDNTEDENHAYQFAKALASKERIKILRLLANRSMNIYEISKTLQLPFSTTLGHISILEEAGIIFVSTQQGKKRHVKMCSRQLSSLTFFFQEQNATNTSDSFVSEMPVGQFTESHISPPCGLFIIDETSKQNYGAAIDTPAEIFTPERFKAELLWFNHGFVSYNFMNKLYQKNITKLELSFECCSEITYHRDKWPSDIFIKINDIDLLTFTSPGDFGGRRGKFSPREWSINSTQYGLLYNIRIDNTGCYLNNIFINKKTIDQFQIPDSPFIKLSIGVKENAIHCGGINLFGKNFGDYNQAIILSISP